MTQASRDTVTFVQPSGDLTVRLTNNTTRGICEAARTLKVRYYVAAVDYLGIEPVWGVFDMTRAQKNNPTPNTWTVGDPVKTFPLEALDAAAMYAAMLAGRKP